MRRRTGWVIGLMALAIGSCVLGFPPPASAYFVLALQEDGGPITPVVTGASFSPVTASGTFGNFGYTFFSAVAYNGACGSGLLSATTQITSRSAGTHTLNLYVSNQDYTLPADTLLAVRSSMGGTYGAEPGFTAGATFQMWADAANGSLTMPVSFTNGLQVAFPTSGNAVTFGTGADPTGIFTRGDGPFSVTDMVSITTTGLGDVNYSTHVNVNPTPVPEPSTLLLLATGLAGLGGVAWRRRKS